MQNLTKTQLLEQIPYKFEGRKINEVLIQANKNYFADPWFAVQVLKKNTNIVYCAGVKNVYDHNDVYYEIMEDIKVIEDCFPKLCELESLDKLNKILLKGLVYSEDGHWVEEDDTCFMKMFRAYEKLSYKKFKKEGTSEEKIAKTKETIDSTLIEYRNIIKENKYKQ